MGSVCPEAPENQVPLAFEIYLESTDTNTDTKQKTAYTYIGSVCPEAPENQVPPQLSFDHP